VRIHMTRSKNTGSLTAKNGTGGIQQNPRTRLSLSGAVCNTATPAARPARATRADLTVANWSGQWPAWWDAPISKAVYQANKRYSHCEPRLHRRVFFVKACARAEQKAGQTRHTDVSHIPRSRSSCPVARNQVCARFVKRNLSWASLMRLHGDVQRHHPDELLFPLGVFKERLSQSALYARCGPSQKSKRAPCTTGCWRTA